jgi:glycosyltransferase involved in cell wall biosynthesis
VNGSTTAPVTVVIPTFNSAATIHDSLASVAAQTARPAEVIVVDDGSRDGTPEMVRAAAEQLGLPVRVVEFPTNRGPSAARNRGWDEATHDLVAFLDADDRWHPRKLELQSELMLSRPELAMSCHAHRFDFGSPWDETDRSIGAEDVSLRAFLVRNRCATPTVMLRRDVSLRFDEDQRHAEDYLLWMRVAHRHGPIARIPVALTQCSNPRYGGTGLSGRLWAMERAELRGFAILRREDAVGYVEWLAASSFSLAKFLVRVIDSRVVRVRRRAR